MMDWDSYFTSMAELVASKSKDRSTKVGCVIVGPSNEVRSTGYNGFCRGIDDALEARHCRPEKYLWTEHAERNAIYNAARNGIRLEDCTLYSTVFPCSDCARGIIQSGIKRVVTAQYNKSTSMPDQSFDRALEMFTEVGVELVYQDNT
jgi:dCMP deaminase